MSTKASGAHTPEGQVPEIDWKSMPHENTPEQSGWVQVLCKACDAKNEFILVTRFQKIVRGIFDEQNALLAAEKEKSRKLAEALDGLLWQFDNYYGHIPEDAAVAAARDAIAKVKERGDWPL